MGWGWTKFSDGNKSALSVSCWKIGKIFLPLKSERDYCVRFITCARHEVTFSTEQWNDDELGLFERLVKPRSRANGPVPGPVSYCVLFWPKGLQVAPSPAVPIEFRKIPIWRKISPAKNARNSSYRADWFQIWQRCTKQFFFSIFYFQTFNMNNV